LGGQTAPVFCIGLPVGYMFVLKPVYGTALRHGAGAPRLCKMFVGGLSCSYLHHDSVMGF